MQDNKERKMSENTGSFIKKKRQYQEMGMKILHICRSEICARFPFFSYASAALSAVVETNMFPRSMGNESYLQSWNHGIGTDGERIIADPVFLIYTWAENPERLKRGCLHMLFHCLYQHPFSDKKMEERLWNVACDLAVELLIWQNIPENLWQYPSEELQKRRQIFEFIEGRNCSAQVLYQLLKQEKLPFNIEELESLFSFDDHSLWSVNPWKREQKRSRWEKILTYTTLGRERQKHRIGASPGSKEEELEELYKSRYDYRKFLRKFAFPREEIQLDEDSFDYIFYNFGMEQYGNLPLIEPLEYKEVNRQIGRAHV